MRNKRIFVFAVIAVLAVAALRGQNLPSDELRLDSRPYKPPPDIALRVQTNLVEVRVVVRDSGGQPVAGLPQSAFELYDNGKLQTISAFSVENLTRRSSGEAAVPAPAAGPAPPPVKAPPPRFVALFFDDWNMRMGELAPTRKAAQDFIHNSLEPGDRVGIFTSSGEVTQEFTSETPKLLDAVSRLRSRYRRPDGGFACPRIRPYQAHLIVDLHDQAAIDLGVEEGYAARCFVRNAMAPDQAPAMVKSNAARILSNVEQYSRETMDSLKEVIQYLGKMSGRRMLVLASSGFLSMNTSLQRVQDRLVDVALRAGIIINALDAKGLAPDVAGASLEDGPPVPTPLRPDFQSLVESITVEQNRIVNDPLAYLAEGTGGRFFHNNNDLGRGLRELAGAPSVSYLLGFAPANLKLDGSYHELKVKLASDQHYSVEARRGYLAPDKPPLPPSGFSVRFENEVFGNGSLSEIPITVNTHSSSAPSGEPVLRVILRVDPRGLSFQKRGDRNVENLRFIVALFDPQGKFLAGIDGAIDLSLKDETLARITEQGLEQGLSLQAPQGPYKLRLVLEELMHGRIASLSQQVVLK